MKKVGLLVFCFLMFASNALAQNPLVAVLDLENGTEYDAGVIKVLSETFRTEFSGLPNFDVVDRSNMDKVLSEHQLQVSDCISSECKVRVGQILGVNYIAVGSLGKLEDTYVFNVQVINVESGLVTFSAREKCQRSLNELDDMIAGTARKFGDRSLSTSRTTQSSLPDPPLSVQPSSTNGQGSLKLESDPPGVGINFHLWDIN
jgi:TolB-like protein